MGPNLYLHTFKTLNIIYAHLSMKEGSLLALTYRGIVGTPYERV
jgi:hypothetical protein